MNRSAPRSATTTAIVISLIALQSMATDIYLPSLPSLTDALGASVAEGQLTLSLFVASFAVAQVAVGPLSDRFGRRPVLMAGAALYAVASLACALAPSIAVLIAARMLQAVGACAGVVLGRAVVRDIHGREGSAAVMATVGSALAIGLIIGPILGSHIEVWLGWRWNFGLLFLLGAADLLAVWLVLPETHGRRPGIALGLRAILGSYGVIIRNRGFLANALTFAFSYAGLFAYLSGSSFVLIRVLGADAGLFGYLFVACVAGYFTGTRLAAMYAPRLGQARMLALGGTINLIGGGTMAGLALSGAVTPGAFGVGLLLACMFVYLTGYGIVMPTGTAGALGPFPERAGAASALTGILQMTLAAAVGLAVGLSFDGTALPMTLVIAAMGIGARLMPLWLNPRPGQDGRLPLA